MQKTEPGQVPGQESGRRMTFGEAMYLLLVIIVVIWMVKMLPWR